MLLLKKKYKLQIILYYFIIYKIKNFINFLKNVSINFNEYIILKSYISLIKYNFYHYIKKYIKYKNFQSVTIHIKQLKILYFFFFKFKKDLFKFNVDYNINYFNLCLSKYIKFINIFLLKIKKKENKVLKLEKKQLNLFNISAITRHKYLDYLQQNKLEKFKAKRDFWAQHGVTKRYVNRFQFIWNPIRVWKNSLYLYHNFPFFFKNFYLKFKDINIAWLIHNQFVNRYNLYYRNIFIGYMKQVHSSFHNIYYDWLHLNKKIIIILNVNRKKNNLYFTLNNKKGNTLSNISVGIFYKLKRNLNIRKNPFKKSIEYLVNEMFLSIFYGKFVNLLQLNTIEKNEEYFKDTINAKNIDRELKFYKNKIFFRKRHRIYFMFKYLKKKSYFPGLQQTLSMHIDNKMHRRIFSFIGIEKKKPRVHNGCRKKKIRRL